MTAEQDIAKPSAAEAPAATNPIQIPIQIAEQLADSLWRLSGTWNDFAKTTMAIPLTRALDGIGLQLRLTLGRSSVKQHLQHIEKARRALVPADYYLQRAHQRGLIEAAHAQQLHGQMIELARRLDQHGLAIIQATNKKLAEDKRHQEIRAKAAQSEIMPDATAEATVAH